MLIRLRSLVFILWLYGAIVVASLVSLPILVMDRRYTREMIRTWAKCVLWGLRVICGTKVEFRGLEHMPQGASLVAGKHLSMLDTIAPFVVLPDPCFIFKRELMFLPFFGWYVLKSNMVAVKRDDAAKALKRMVIDTKDRLKDARQVMIFPEGTRSELNELDPDYKPGVAALYRELDCPCGLLATNSGQYWPAHGVDRLPGTIVFEFLPALPAGLKRAELMKEIKARLEQRSRALIDELAPPKA